MQCRSWYKINITQVASIQIISCIVSSVRARLLRLKTITYFHGFLEYTVIVEIIRPEEFRTGLRSVLIHGIQI